MQPHLDFSECCLAPGPYCGLPVSGSSVHFTAHPLTSREFLPSSFLLRLLLCRHLDCALQWELGALTEFVLCSVSAEQAAVDAHLQLSESVKRRLLLPHALITTHWVHVRYFWWTDGEDHIIAHRGRPFCNSGGQKSQHTRYSAVSAPLNHSVWPGS